MYRAPITNNTVRRPYLSAGLPAVKAPRMVPMIAVVTVMPNPASSRLNTVLRDSVVPEITAVSKPKMSPPMDATMALRSTRGFIGVMLAAATRLVNAIHPEFVSNIGPSRIFGCVGRKDA